MSMKGVKYVVGKALNLVIEDIERLKKSQQYGGGS